MPSTTIFDDLKADHERHRALLTEIAEAKGDKARRKTLFETFRIEVSGHAAAEEQTLYATMLADPELQEDARHSVSEHKEIEDMLTNLSALTTDDEAWNGAFADMRTRYDHHITEEEEEMFPAASERLTDADATRLADVFETRKPAEKRKAAATDPTKEKERE